VSAKLAVDDRRRLKTFLAKNRRLFATSIKDLGCFRGPRHAIRTTTDRPVCTPPHRHSLPERQTISAKIKEMLDAGIIRPSTDERRAWSAS
jgi:hypothetical protein